MTTRLIDWGAALQAAHNAVSRPDAMRDAVATAEGGPVFRNKDFPLSPVPLLLRSEPANELRPLLTAYVDVLGKVVQLYRTRPEVRAFYGLGADADRLIDADRALGDPPWVCRLDGYLEQGTERLRVLENNADSPAGTLFTARINEAVAGIGRAVSGVDTELDGLTYRREHIFVDALRAAARAAAERDPGRCADPRRVAVLQPAGAPNRESVELVAVMRGLGIDAFLADPVDLTVDGGQASFAGQVADLCWNKVNTVSWHGYRADPDFVERWAAAVADTPMVHVNPFGARYVAESKLTLALVQEPAFADLFTDAERSVVGALLPWARKVTPDATDEDGRSLVECLLADPREFVIKQPYDIRGDGVTIGHDCPPSAWRDAVEHAVRDGHIAQRRVVPAGYPVVDAGTAGVRTLAVSVDTYLLGGEVAGFGSKASAHSKINIFQGGQKLAVHVTAGAR